jgi:hypothetical protein
MDYWPDRVKGKCKTDKSLAISHGLDNWLKLIGNHFLSSILHKSRKYHLCDFLLIYIFDCVISELGKLMKRGKLNLEKKAALIKEQLKGRTSFTVSDARNILEEKEPTLYWTLSNLARNGIIARNGQGLYSFEIKEKEIQPILSFLAQRILKILQESGQEFFISGLDILSIFMEHIPETYPVLLFVNKYSLTEISETLSRSHIDTISSSVLRDYSPLRQMASIKELTLLIPTREFTYAENGLASFEKAFVDLYYEVTRKNYPLPIQELARIYINMKRRTSLNTNRLIKIASRRNIHQDLRYIIEHEYITDAAVEFVKILENGKR